MAQEHDSESSVPNPDLVLRELDTAIATGQFFLLYQPTIDLQTNAFIGVEAFLRWRHPQRGILSPDAFLPALESSGRIVPAGAWVLASACRQGADWHERGHRFTVSVNVSQRQLASPTIVTDVERALDESRFDPGHLVLEFSEGSLTSTPGASTALSALKGIGVRLAIDDFGAAPGAEAVVTQFPIDVVKIDRAFITGLSTSPSNAARVHELVQLGKSLHVQTVAQGIEDDDQRRRLLVEDVDAGQGFLLSTPHDVDEIDHFLEDYAIFSGKPL